MKVIRMVAATAMVAAGFTVPVGVAAQAAPTHTAVKASVSEAPAATLGLRRTPRY